MGILKFKKGLLVYLVPATLMYSVFFIYPFIQALYYSFFEWDGIFEPVFNGVKNFTALFKERVFQESIVRVVKWAVLAGVLQSGLGLTLAFLLRGKAKCNSLFRSAYFVPVVISSAAVCVMFTVMYDKDIGLVNSFLDGVGLGSLKHVWLGRPFRGFLCHHRCSHLAGHGLVCYDHVFRSAVNTGGVVRGGSDRWS